MLDIKPIKKKEKIVGLTLLTITNAIFIVYTKNNKLCFDKVQLETDIKCLFVEFHTNLTDTVWIMYSDTSKTYYIKKVLASDQVQKVKSEDKYYICLQYYDANIVLALTDDKKLIKIYTDNIQKIVDSVSDEFVRLEPEMLIGTELIVKRIMEHAQELQSLNQILEKERQELRRINLYAYKKKFKVYPEITVNRILDEQFLIMNFRKNFPPDTYIIVTLEFKKQKLFCMKRINDEENIVEMRIPKSQMNCLNECTIDLVTKLNEVEPWCLTRDCITNVSDNDKKNNLSKDKELFLKNKIKLLKNLMKEGTVDMKKLSEIKKSMRKEIDSLD